MKKLLFIALLLSGNANADNSIGLSICKGEYALCAASPTKAIPGKKVTINGLEFDAGVAVCPVLKGLSIANLSLMNGSCKAPEGKVWSLFAPLKSYPQAPTWETVPAVIRTFTTTSDSGMSNMWSMICEKQKSKTNGVQLADCYGPLNESPWTGTAIPVGTLVGTAAPVGATYPVGGNFP